jgi:predicted O-linked N-acetylglucosamine transferase (SPINDLY family)
MKHTTTKSAHLKEIIKQMQGGNFANAIALAEKALKRNERDYETLYLKAIIFQENSDIENAKACLSQVLAINPLHLNSLIDLAQIKSDSNNTKEALELGLKASKLDPQNIQIKIFLIGTYIKAEKFHEARKITQELLAINPKHDLALYLLAMSYFKEKNMPEGCKYAIQALEINPKLTNIRLLMSEYYGRYELKYPIAIKLLEDEAVLNPRSDEVYKFLGNYYGKLGEINKAIEFTRLQLKLNPNDYSSHNNLLFFLPYSPKTTNQEILEASKNFYQQCILLNKSFQYTSYTNEKTPNKKLKIGFVSGDFRNHALLYWLKGFFEELKKYNCEVVCYCNNKEDSISESWKKEVDEWHNVIRIDDKELAKKIHQEEIDILIDLSGHTEHNRLRLFAIKPAPIQMTWLGQSGPMGLPEIDYMISDNYMIEPGEEKFYTEKITRLPNVYAPYTNAINLEINPAPCLTKHYITFGCLNNFIKINNEVIDTWIEILHQVADSKLILKSHLFADQDVVKNLKEYFLKYGITKERLEFEPFDLNREKYLQTYLKIDIALDPFPFGGGTTTHDLILMGIPLITLYGKRLSNRSSSSILHHIGCPELITYSKDEYIKKAIKLASDFNSISNYRSSLRNKYQASPLNDLETFTKNFSNTLRAIWQEYCIKE